MEEQKVLYIRLCDNNIHCVEVMPLEDAKRAGMKWVNIIDKEHRPKHNFGIYKLPLINITVTPKTLVGDLEGID